MPPARNGIAWSREELMLAFRLYCQIPFSTIDMRNPRIIALADLLGRSVGSVSYKLANFSRLDPVLQARGIRGLSGGSKGEVAIWDEYRRDAEGFAYKCDRELAKWKGESLEKVAEIAMDDLPPMIGREREAIIRQRVNQSFFRRRILSVYNFRCCVTGLAVPDLLVASHITPWAADEKNRLNPRNGLCLNALHDRAFDRCLMWVDDSFTVHFSHKLKSASKVAEKTMDWLTSFAGKTLSLPTRFTPDPELLRQHAKRCYT